MAFRWTEKNRLFCWHYARLQPGQSATDCAKAAGYGGPGRSIHNRATVLFKHQEIRDEIHRQRKELMLSKGVDKDQLMAETIARAGFRDRDGNFYVCEDFFKEDMVEDVVEIGETTHKVKRQRTTFNKDLPREAKRMVKSITVTPSKFGDKIKVELWDQLKCIELLGKFTGDLANSAEGDTVTPGENARKIREALAEMDVSDGVTPHATH
jgi:phage terminase small subunit